MPITVEWLQTPHLLQITFQGQFALEDMIQAAHDVYLAYGQQQAHPFGILAVILPDRTIPIGLLQLATHPATKFLQYVDAVAVVGVDHVLIGSFIELLGKHSFAPPITHYPTYEAGLKAVQQMLRAQQAGL